jgi:hypothetical protein
VGFIETLVLGVGGGLAGMEILKNTVEGGVEEGNHKGWTNR